MPLTFQAGNAKLSKSIVTFSLPAFFTCPGAFLCASKACPKTNKVIDMHTKEAKATGRTFRCSSASTEVVFRTAARARWSNFKQLTDSKDMASLIHYSLPNPCFVVRVHVSGDYFSQDYFDAWLKVAKLNPQTIFYSYTKSLPFWIARLGQIPANFRLRASLGGKFDSLIAQYSLPFSQVVFSFEEARALGLPVDHDDSIAIEGKDCSALLLHGTQPKETFAAESMRNFKKAGWTGYNKNKQNGNSTSNNANHGSNLCASGRV